jgi:hypothetical protein
MQKKGSSYARMQEKNLLEPILEKISTIASGATPIGSADRAPDEILVFKSENYWYCFSISPKCGKRLG